MATALVYPLRRRQPGAIGSLVLDATLSGQHQYDGIVTSETIEGGAQTSDHISLDPKRLTMVGLVTDTPLSGADPTRSASALQELISLQESRQTLTVVTNLLVYTDMAFKSLRFGESAQNGRALRFTAEFQKMDSAESATVAVPAERLAPVAAAGDPPGTNADQAQSKVSVGNQQKQEPSEPEQQQASVLYRVFN